MHVLHHNVEYKRYLTKFRHEAIAEVPLPFMYYGFLNICIDPAESG